MKPCKGFTSISPSNCDKKKGKVVYGQEPPSGESTTTECGFNYPLLAVITKVAQWGAPIVPDNYNQLRTMASETVDPIDWPHPPPYTEEYPLSSTYCTLHAGCKSQDLLHCYARPTHCRCCHSEYRFKFHA